MKKVIIYTTADKRPDFIPVQYESLKKFITDDYEYVVLNNALGSKKRRALISKTCEGLGVKCIEVKKDPRFSMIGGQEALNLFGHYKNANVGTAYPIKWGWENICESNKENLVVVIDSDMFLCQKISFNQELGEQDASFVMQYRGVENSGKSALVTYPWNGICIFNTGKIQNLKDLNWDCGILKKYFINGYAVDVGGYGHFWLKENKIEVRHISEYAIHDFRILPNNQIYLKASLNGNFQYSFEYDTQTRIIRDFKVMEGWWQVGNQILPHFPENFENTMVRKTISYFEKFILNKQTYPAPVFLGFIEFENFTETINPFVIHNKAGSGYMGFDANYGRLKLEFIRKTLDISAKLDEKIFRLKNTLFNRNIKITIKMLRNKINSFFRK